MTRKFSKLGYSIEQRGKRSWRITVSTSEGRVTRTVHADTKVAARRLAEKFRDEVEAGYDKDVANKTVFEHA